MSQPLKLYAESTFMSPWVFHAMVALEEMQLPYKVEVVPLPIPPETKAELQKKSVIGKVPILVDGDVWITESLAITEYLSERFGQAPRIYPTDIVERARAAVARLLRIRAERQAVLHRIGRLGARHDRLRRLALLDPGL